MFAYVWHKMGQSLPICWWELPIMDGLWFPTIWNWWCSVLAQKSAKKIMMTDDNTTIPYSRGLLFHVASDSSCTNPCSTILQECWVHLACNYWRLTKQIVHGKNSIPLLFASSKLRRWKERWWFINLQFLPPSPSPPDILIYQPLPLKTKSLSDLN